jgi:hypothetical protein
MPSLAARAMVGFHPWLSLLNSVEVLKGCISEWEPSRMPWNPGDAERHTHKATTRALKELWAKVANEYLERTGDEGRAIREANAVIARQAEPG